MAISLEQQSRMQLTGESLEQQIAETYASHKAEPKNVDFARRLGVERGKGGYGVRDRLVSIRGRPNEWSGCRPGPESFGSENEMPGTRDCRARGISFDTQRSPCVACEKIEELKAAKAKRAEILIDEARERVDRNPTDLQLRFELGGHLVSARRFREAVPELQRARQNPNARLKAMNLLGCCYRELGMLDLAMKQLEEASKETLPMDAMKKDIVYNLGLVYEQMGEHEKSLACMKQIYEVEHGYKDVAFRVESSYQQNIS